MAVPPAGSEGHTEDASMTPSPTLCPRIVFAKGGADMSIEDFEIELVEESPELLSHNAIF